MTKRLLTLSALLALGAFTVRAQQHDEHSNRPNQEMQRQEAPHGNQGRIPPPPQHRDNQHTSPVYENSNGHEDRTPHVNNDRWYGHAEPNDRRYSVDRPYAHGHFEHFGPDYRYGVERIDRDHHRFWFPGGFYFQIADPDWALTSSWCWNCPNEFVVYEDPDHPGWYLVYDTATGTYVHAEYMGM
jgi:hypothetical protein